MTAIVGVKDEISQAIFIGADSAAVNDEFEVGTWCAKKLFFKNNFLIGYCGSFRGGQLIQHNFEIPRKTTTNHEKYFLTEFIPELQECFNSNNFDWTKEEIELLIGFGENLYFLQSDMAIFPCTDKYFAIGYGASYALSSLYTSEHLRDSIPTDARIKMAMESAAYFNKAVYGPYKILELKFNEN